MSSNRNSFIQFLGLIKQNLDKYLISLFDSTPPDPVVISNLMCIYDMSDTGGSSAIVVM